MTKEKDLTGLADFIYEAGILDRTQRSGFWFLGTGKQNVAAHSYRTTVIAYALAQMEKDADEHKVLTMALFHDFAEARISDLNYVHQKYVEVDEEKAIDDAFEKVSFGKEVKEELSELDKKESLEAKIVKDADNLELLAMLRDEQEKGNERTDDWIVTLLKRFKTQNGKKLAKQLLERHPDDWWFDRGGDWWTNRDKSKL